MSETLQPSPLPPSVVRLSCAPSTAAARALGVLLHELADRISLHRARVVESGAPDALHDLRVAMRRTRSALADVRGVIPGRRRRELGDRFKRLGGESGPLRDLDVLAESLRDEVPATEGRDIALIAIVERAKRRRTEFVATLRRAEVPGWIDALRSLPKTGRAAESPISQVAARTLGRTWRRFRAAGDTAVASRGDGAIHRLRIRGKRLRYALEFFGDVAPSETHSLPDVPTLKAFQDLLGAHNDLAIQLELLAGLQREVPDGVGAEYLVGAIEARTAALEVGRSKIVAGWPIADADG